ncbi:MAG: hypothetical protein A2W97_14455 [Bacteroidetes bacterium GWE2_40_63]|nr:MAG: hypothetical protein A2W84_05040 [Bacteroidetes bacterium GWC2_40_13]OFX75490.1 MAG: hypothetical protein A2W96_08530 [Bacteroidetes bacterium GWD2_40_43]OFX94005.1 MAG: hypothetical protein A2W97_14455 [Bacteroidetes bacterium GWE2_40_63]OFY19792.1 MAG: hypothetical protein A2W88_03325 [Bacteroidetes bacterium GWF2_40_13]OFZ28205.1 MAG: hypothetical protein A2437_04820 [Bacteroidetes bacterium RIFOXYC2_FULL_40_12]
MHNVGKIDRIIRISVAIILAILYFTKVADGKLGTTAFIVIAVVLAATSLRRCCPIYALLGMGTCGTGVDEKEATIKTEKLDLK